MDCTLFEHVRSTFEIKAMLFCLAPYHNPRIREQIKRNPCIIIKKKTRKMEVACIFGIVSGILL